MHHQILTILTRAVKMLIF